MHAELLVLVMSEIHVQLQFVLLQVLEVVDSGLHINENKPRATTGTDMQAFQSHFIASHGGVRACAIPRIVFYKRCEGKYGYRSQRGLEAVYTTIERSETSNAIHCKISSRTHLLFPVMS